MFQVVLHNTDDDPSHFLSLLLDPFLRYYEQIYISPRTPCAPVDRNLQVPSDYEHD
jgi:hypothetical protein